MKCSTCDDMISEIRLEALPNTKTCLKCSTEQPKIGLMEYAGKTAGEIIILPDNAEQRRLALQAYNRDHEGEVVKKKVSYSSEV